MEELEIRISFRKLRPSDVPDLVSWLQDPEIAEWWARPTDGDLTDLWTKYAHTPEPDTDRYIIEFDGSAVGEIQVGDLSRFPEIEQEIGIPDAASVDIFLRGTHRGRGIGTAATKKFLRDFVFTRPGIQTCTIDPDPNNTRAIRSYEKAGFKHVRTYHTNVDDVDLYLMRLDRPSSKPGSL